LVDGHHVALEPYAYLYVTKKQTQVIRLEVCLEVVKEGDDLLEADQFGVRAELLLQQGADEMEGVHAGIVQN